MLCTSLAGTWEWPLYRHYSDRRSVTSSTDRTMTRSYRTLNHRPHIDTKPSILLLFGNTDLYIPAPKSVTFDSSFTTDCPMGCYLLAPACRLDLLRIDSFFLHLNEVCRIQTCYACCGTSFASLFFINPCSCSYLTYAAHPNPESLFIGQGPRICLQHNSSAGAVRVQR